jgi:outer membrane protein OmpA-like peptidoglycan-associated protein
MNASCNTALLACLAALMLGGCAQKSYVALLESPDGTTGQVIVKSNRGEQVISTARQGAPLDGSSPPAPVDEAKLKKDFAEAMAARPLPPDHFQLYFESGGAILTAESAAMLPKIVEAASRRPAVDISVIGHTDTAGKAELNEALALKRANAVADMLKAQGLKAHALAVESHGERNLLVKTPDETAEPRNRRVEISIR